MSIGATVTTIVCATAEDHVDVALWIGVLPDSPLDALRLGLAPRVV